MYTKGYIDCSLDLSLGSLIIEPESFLHCPNLENLGNPKTLILKSKTHAIYKLASPLHLLECINAKGIVTYDLILRFFFFPPKFNKPPLVTGSFTKSTKKLSNFEEPNIMFIY